MGIKIVIVDDAPFIREVMRSLLDGTEIKVIGEAADGVSAVPLILRLQPDVVLLDLVLPQMNGFDVARAVIAQAPHIQLIACTTLTQENLAIQALDAGFINYVTKPFTAAGLLKAIRACEPPQQMAQEG